MTEFSLAIVQFLIENGGDVNEPLESGESAIFQAALQGNVGAVKLLMDHGADPEFVVPNLKISTIEWVRSRFDGTSKVAEKDIYAAMLTHMTGKHCSAPPPPELSPNLKAENERLVIALLRNCF